LLAAGGKRPFTQTDGSGQFENLLRFPEALRLAGAQWAVCAKKPANVLSEGLAASKRKLYSSFVRV
jgi:hypothetical protein